ncbi:hypothetical protein EWB00_008564 [Schistosoma japonicum]|uniref:Uncharacterized protein n=1 Tax=Schistosoma japonicum TaxID=6182 RepID=A0A4Z2CPP6_SCHJA|nr:hypothetical protein EWB00_008564 [Schistosoma japonicum]
MGFSDDVKDFEKVVVDPCEPLVLRPPVGSEVYGSPPSRRSSRSRPFILGSLFVLFTLLMVASVFLLLYILGYRPLASLNHKANSHRSICRIRIPFLKIDPVESITTDENFLNVTLSEVPYYNVIRILHLFSEGLTVIRTNKHCYIRPLRAELRGSRIEDYLRRLNDGSDLKDSVESYPITEPWYIDKDPYNTIHSSLIMSWCAGVPAFRLVSRPPISGHKVDMMPVMPDESVKPPNPNPFVNEYDNGDQADILRILLPDRENIRRVRSIDLATAMRVKPEELPISLKKLDTPSNCEIVDVLLEDATITSTHDNQPVSILRDVIMHCP